jgi:hypothetical protein
MLSVNVLSSPTAPPGSQRARRTGVRNRRPFCHWLVVKVFSLDFDWVNLRYGGALIRLETL